jgi:1-phosphofructokinase family hexose kinase
VIAFVSASPSIDRLLHVPAVRVGEIHRPRDVVAVAGGKGLNAARAAHSLGAGVIVVALLCGHAGRWIAGELRAEGVAVEVVPGPGETRISLSVASDDGGVGLTEFYEPAPEVDLATWESLEAAVETVARDVRWVAVSGSLPPGAPDGAYRRLSEVARRAGARVALDARGAGLAAGLEAQPDFVKVNTAEAAELGIGAASALRTAAGGGERVAAITHGADGMELALPFGRGLRAVPPVLGTYPVGSGDAALGGFLAALDAGGDWEAALALAAGAAAANAEIPGAGRLDGRRAHELARDAASRVS